MSRRRSYHAEYYRANRARRAAQRLASKYGCPADWRAFLPVARQVIA